MSIKVDNVYPLIYDITDSKIVVALKFPLHLVHETGISSTLYQTEEC